MSYLEWNLTILSAPGDSRPTSVTWVFSVHDKSWPSSIRSCLQSAWISSNTSLWCTWVVTIVSTAILLIGFMSSRHIWVSCHLGCCISFFFLSRSMSLSFWDMEKQQERQSRAFGYREGSSGLYSLSSFSFAGNRLCSFFSSILKCLTFMSSNWHSHSGIKSLTTQTNVLILQWK